ncbi:hypothetical protein K435DRAFT_820342 [Dendrothele bispora CBS 962.96]|uniref:Tc1-like transposase DDE domain-containing protein n=1 Tax=Dendrothele bispora (strain CBS 962.96) TaxID=1314807 RepID=A0A4S8LU30_DENBC|nr:hypothetical protein K435DRAFT_820342 [Dendrothele bispora CBS 962.96]
MAHFLNGDRSDLEDYCTGCSGWGVKWGQTWPDTPWDHGKPPTEKMALDVLATLDGILRPHKGKPESSDSKGRWMDASVQTAAAKAVGKKGGKGGRYGHARRIRERAKQSITEQDIPANLFGKWVRSRLQPDTEFAHDIQVHLLSCGKYVCSQDIVDYLARPDTVSPSTAKHWMGQFGYRFVRNHTRQYVNGHDLLPAWYSLEGHMKSWTRDNILELVNGVGCPVVIWFHDESIFYAHDRKKLQWVKNNDSPTPYAKGEGVSLMVADFVSMDYGWLCSKDNKRSARVIFRPGKNCNGYFTNEDIVAQAKVAMDILESDYPDEEHILVYDNATTHLKHAATAPSAAKMPKMVSKDLESNWGVMVPMKGPNSRFVYDEKGKKKMEKVKMADGKFGGKPYSFYFPEIDPETGLPHPKAGLFKGMVTILQERGYSDWSKVRYECEGFKCDPHKNGECCCQRKVYNEPDMVNGKSVLETTCTDQNFRVLFLPKFHCELNPIEQCWGHAKWHYRLLPALSKEEELEKNMISSLDKLDIVEI